MRQNLNAVKAEIETILKDHLREEGLELLTAPHTATSDESPLVMFEGIEDLALEGSLLQWEIRVILGILGKAWQCDRLVDGIYRAISAYRPTATELTALLTSLHVEVTHVARTRGVSKRATIRYIVTE
jgi:predicted xylose isomerase-like sugar epimerase